MYSTLPYHVAKSLNHKTVLASCMSSSGSRLFECKYLRATRANAWRDCALLHREPLDDFEAHIVASTLATPILPNQNAIRNST